MDTGRRGDSNIEKIGNKFFNKFLKKFCRGGNRVSTGFEYFTRTALKRHAGSCLSMVRKVKRHGRHRYPR